LGKPVDYYLVLGQVNLAFQIFVHALLFVSLLFLKRGRLFSHGTGMLIAVVLNAVSFFLVMGPSLIGRIQLVEANPFGRLSLIAPAHAIVGGAGEVLGIWIVAVWHLQSAPQKCAMRKRIMSVAPALWVIAILLGFLLYGFIANLIQ
jgi:uncharacterized membrane protein YozB (DUF420 family)